MKIILIRIKIKKKFQKKIEDSKFSSLSKNIINIINPLCFKWPVVCTRKLR